MASRDRFDDARGHPHLEEARSDRVDAHAVTRPFDSEVTRERDHRTLARGIACGVEDVWRSPDHADHRRYVDDGAAAGVNHLASGGLGHQEASGGVGRHYLLPLPGCHRLGWRGPTHACVVHEHVDTAEARLMAVTVASTCATSATSHVAARQSMPRAGRSCSAASSQLVRRAVIAMAALASPSVSAISRPKPREPPVTSATLLVRSNSDGRSTTAR